MALRYATYNPLFHSLCFVYFPQILKLLFVTHSCLTLHDPMDCSTPSFTLPHHLPKFAQVHVHCIGDAIELSHPLMPSSPSSLNLSQHQGIFLSWLFASDGQNISVSASASALPTEHSGLISLKIDWFDLLAVHRTFRSLLQHHGLKASILWRSAFFTVQLSQPYMTTGKTTALTVWIFIGNVSAFQPTV